jgi:ureidoglycolate amidohydrolase
MDIEHSMRRRTMPWVVLVLALAALLPVRALKVDIDGQAVVDQLMHLAAYSDHPNPAVTRILFTGAAAA